jgi:hypothetical protein
VRIIATLALALTVTTGADELNETLSWMDNTFNAHERNGTFGHGHTGWYTRDTTKGPLGEILVSGLTQSFTSDGCRMTLHQQDDPAADLAQFSYSSFTRTFDLRDINPQSIKMHTLSRMGGFYCEQFGLPPEDCDHAEITFVTHGEAPLIDEDWDVIHPKLQGSQHEVKSQSKTARSHFFVDNVEYATRFAKAFRHAVELCGGKPEPFEER